MSVGLMALFDDVATLAKAAAASIDDVAGQAAKAGSKAAGVVIDDTAVTPRYLTGFSAARELPIVGRIALGSLKNKILILLPAALAFSLLLPQAITPLLMLGGAFLCFEGVEKLLHKWLHGAEQTKAEHQAHVAALANEAVDMVAFERDKVKGAVRTDFILSAEIIVISLGTVAGATFGQQVGVLVGISILMTVGVYGLVAGIVKLDDLGLRLTRAASGGAQALGRGILATAPWLMKGLSVAGTAAMFLVGGGILTHGVPVLHHVNESLGFPLSMAFDAVVGIAAGLVVVGGVTLVQRLRGR